MPSLAPQVKIIKAPTLEELETKINEWMIQAHNEGLQVDYLGTPTEISDGSFFYLIDYHDPYEPEEEEHHT